MPRKFMLLLIAAVFCAPLLTTGCAEHRHVYYDSYTNQQYPYAEENPHYRDWESQTHRNHEDFNKRSKDDQKAYWDWRNKNDKGHDQKQKQDHDQNPH
ncbi:MAG TPA: hypothetical protein VHU89_08495 [Acidobacteriaceae bacterium]|nr:hypothetical protein [Acidobacteriaceae bacterium]